MAALKSGDHFNILVISVLAAVFFHSVWDLSDPRYKRFLFEPNMFRVMIWDSCSYLSPCFIYPVQHCCSRGRTVSPCHCEVEMEVLVPQLAPAETLRGVPLSYCWEGVGVQNPHVVCTYSAGSDWSQVPGCPLWPPLWEYWSTSLQLHKGKFWAPHWDFVDMGGAKLFVCSIWLK